jgi:3-oxoacyl-[acyl-carrier-protein] synthase II
VNTNPTITGLGLITPLGRGVEQTWRALLEKQFIRDHARVPETFIRDTGQPVAGSLAHHARTESPCHSDSRVSLLARHAICEAVVSAAWNRQQLADPETALLVGTSKGPVESWLGGVFAADRDEGFGLSELGTSIARSIRLGAGPLLTYSAACASGLHGLIQAVLLLKSGGAKRALVVAAEASVHPLFIGSFRRLGVLPPEGVGCRPFDRDREGFLISEAAAAVCLEIGSDKPGIARIDRFAMAGDATHLTGSDPDGKAMRYVLGRAVDGRDVDLFHAHATGTKLHDPVELSAIASCNPGGGRPATVYSHKGAVGHSLGAAGLVSIVLNCMAHQTSSVPSNVQTQNPIEIPPALELRRDVVHRPFHRSVALAAGFGGAMAAVSLCSAGGRTV